MGEMPQHGQVEPFAPGTGLPGEAGGINFAVAGKVKGNVAGAADSGQAQQAQGQVQGGTFLLRRAQRTPTGTQALPQAATLL